MTRNSTAPVAAPPAIVAEAWQQVGASFDRFCLASGVAALQTMMEQDATDLCGLRYVHKDGCNGHRWGRAEGKLGFHGGKVSVERPRVRARGQEMALPSWETAQAENWLGRWAEAAKVPSALPMESCRRG